MANLDSEMGEEWVKANDKIVSASKLSSTKLLRGGVFISIFLFNNNLKIP